MQPDGESPIASVVTHGKNRLNSDEFSIWISRLERFLNAQPDSRGAATVGDLRVPKDGGASSGTIIFTANFGSTGQSEKMVLRFHPESGHAHEGHNDPE